MSFNFAPTANQAPAIALIPPGTLALTVLTVKEIKHSNNSGGLMAQLEYTIARGPYERRKIWKYIGDPNDQRNSEKWRQMGVADLQHMLESAGIFDPSKPETYARYSGVKPEHAFTTILGDLDGKHIAVKLRIEKGTDGNEDKNGIGFILSPNPNGRTAKAYADVKAGADMKEPAASPATGGAFGAAAAQPVTAAAGGFGQAAQPAQADSAASGFGSAAKDAAAPAQTGQNAPTWLANQ